MTVKEIIRDALYLLGRVDVAEKYESDYVTDNEGQRVIKTLLYCFNAVQDELARAYFPLKKTEIAQSLNGEIKVSALSEKPIRVLNVLGANGTVDWRIFPDHISVKSGQVTVEYEYCPDKKSENEVVVFGDGAVGAVMVSYGMVAEYCLINGEIENANAWEEKYRREIDNALSSQKVKGRIPPRRWV